MIQGKISPQAWMVSTETRKLMEALGGNARFVGGCVRDALANRRVFDIDIATPLTPEDVIERLKTHNISFVPTGLKHGTVTAIVDGHPFEITTLRRDVATDGRHAEVAFTDDWKEDAARRDFTFNAIFCDMDGNLFDAFGGVADLREGRVRFVGEPAARIEEDVLRILRYFRFLAHFGRGEADEAALKACVDAADKIKTLSAERIRTEVLKLLESDHCADVWALMKERGIVAAFLPDATDVERLREMVSREAEFHTQPSTLRRLAALGCRADVAEKLRFSNDQAARLKDMLENLPKNLSEKDARAFVYRAGTDTVRNRLLLGDKADLAKLYALVTAFRIPRFPLKGEDAMALGKQGPDIGVALRAVEDWWIEEDFQPTREACLQKLKS